MELRFGGSGRHAEHVGDLFVFVSLDVVQHEHATRTRRQPFDGFLEIEEIAGRKRHADHAWQRVHSA